MTYDFDEILYAFELQSNYAVTLEGAEAINIITSTSIKGKLRANLQLVLEKKEVEEIFGRMFPAPVKSKIQISLIFLSDLYSDAYLKTHSLKEGNYFVLPKGTLLHGTIQLDKKLTKRLIEQIKENLELIESVSIHSSNSIQLLNCKTTILSLSTALEAIPQQRDVLEIINNKGEVQVKNIHLKKSKSSSPEKHQIKSAIAKNNISKALVILTTYTKEAKKKHGNDVILLKTTFNQIEMDVIRGQLSKEDEYAYKNRLVNRILKLTDIVFN